MKQSGAAISSRLIPPNVQEIFFTVLMISLLFLLRNHKEKGGGGFRSSEGPRFVNPLEDSFDNVFEWFSLLFNAFRLFRQCF